MKLEVRRFDGPATREALSDFLRSQGCRVLAWADAPGARYPPHEHDHHEIIAVYEGRIDFGAEGRVLALSAGDVLTLPRGTTHTADVPAGGVRYLIGELGI